MKSKNLKEFSNSQILTNGFVGRKKRSDIAVTPPVLCLRRAQGSSAKVQTHGHISESCPKSVRCG